jgi:hypothetical protein
MGKTAVSHLIGNKTLGKGSPFDQKIYAAFDGGKNLPELCLRLLSDQKKVWRALREGCDSLREVREREIHCQEFSVRLQYNPGRIKSSMADVDEKSIKERRCFLCLDHLPDGQQGVLYRNEYLILCNPMPVFLSHFTVSHSDHRLQAIAEYIGTFLRLTADFGPEWMVLYNGPKCGASAPEHLHFQIAPSGQMPIEKEFRKKNRVDLIKQSDHILFCQAKYLGREVIILEGDDAMTVENGLKKVLNALEKALLLSEEPMINAAGFYEDGKWRLVIFPRHKHRPDAFYSEGDRKIVVSPGVIDMGGLLITPVEKDFKRLNKALVEGIYKEVSLDGETMEKVIATLK